MAVKAKKDVVRVNERGIRIGESHPQARLTDAEVEQLILDRGPEDAPLMSFRKLAAKWGLSESGARKIIKGQTRGQIGPTVIKAASRRVSEPKVRAVVRLTLAERARLHRLGGSAWVRKMLRT